MNPVLKCCGYYCTFLMIVGIFFFGVMIALEATESPYLGDFQMGSESSYTTMTRECAWALLINIAGIICCMACTIAQDRKPHEEDDEEDIQAEVENR